MSKAFRRLLPALCIRSFRKCITVLALAMLLPSCAMEGDLGRPKTYTLLGYPLDVNYWASSATHVSGPARFSLTPDEIALREASYRLRTQVHNLTPVKVAYAPESAYAGHLTYEQHSNGPSRAVLLDHELRADHETLSRFADAARRVLAADRERMFALGDNRSFLTLRDQRSARNRMRKNFATIEGTFIDLERRIASYDHAIDRTRIETPGTSLADVEGSLNHLRDRAASLHYELSQSYQVAEGHAHQYPQPDGQPLALTHRKSDKPSDTHALEPIK